jgi:hypothetical protein
MRYKIADIEDQIVATLVQDVNLAGVTTKGHSGEVTPRTFADPSEMIEIIHLLPFVLIQYMGRDVSESNDMRTEYAHRLRFRLYVGSKSLKLPYEQQRAAYEILSLIYDDLHGRWPLGSYAISPDLPLLSGETITVTEFRPLTGLVAGSGTDERLIVNLPDIKVFHTDYTITLLA